MTVFQVASLCPNCRRAPLDAGVFDWQVMPVAAVSAYIRRDFSGMLEGDDLRQERSMNA
jgi:hypothetical protein